MNDRIKQVVKINWIEQTSNKKTWNKSKKLFSKQNIITGQCIDFEMYGDSSRL